MKSMISRKEGVFQDRVGSHRVMVHFGKCILFPAQKREILRETSPLAVVIGFTFVNSQQLGESLPTSQTYPQSLGTAPKKAFEPA